MSSSCRCLLGLLQETSQRQVFIANKKLKDSLPTSDIQVVYCFTHTVSCNAGSSALMGCTPPIYLQMRGEFTSSLQASVFQFLKQKRKASLCSKRNL